MAKSEVANLLIDVLQRKWHDEKQNRYKFKSKLMNCGKSVLNYYYF